MKKKSEKKAFDIMDLHNEAHAIFQKPLDKRTPQEKIRLEEILDIITIENEKYEEKNKEERIPYDWTPKYIPRTQQEDNPQAGRQLTDEWMKDFQRQALESFENVMNGGPNSFRVIAKFGASNYDITITKLEEMEVIQVLIHKFVNSFQKKPNKLI